MSVTCLLTENIARSITMTRRQFIKNILITSLQSMPVLSLMSDSSIAAVSADSETESQHYKPLNGRLLRDIVRQFVQTIPDRKFRCDFSDREARCF